MAKTKENAIDDYIDEIIVKHHDQITAASTTRKTYDIDLDHFERCRVALKKANLKK